MLIPPLATPPAYVQNVPDCDRRREWFWDRKVNDTGAPITCDTGTDEDKIRAMPVSRATPVRLAIEVDDEAGVRTANARQRIAELLKGSKFRDALTEASKTNEAHESVTAVLDRMMSREFAREAARQLYGDDVFDSIR